MTRSRTGGVGLAARQFASSPGTSLLLALVVLLVAFAATATPRALDGLTSAALRHELGALSPVQRDLGSVGVGGPRVGPSALGISTDAVWGAQGDALEQLRLTMPPTLRDATGPAGFTVIFEALNAPSAPGEPGGNSRLRLGFDPLLGDHIRIVSGTMPAEPDQAVSSVTPIDVVLAESAADEMFWSVGEVRELAGGGPGIAVRLSGTFEAIDPGDPFWQHTPDARTPFIDSTGLSEIVTGIGFAAPGSWPAVVDLPIDPRMNTWYPLDIDGATAANADELVLAIRTFTRAAQPNGEAQPGDGFRLPGSPIATVAGFEFTSDAVETIIDEQARATATMAVMGIVAVGPLGGALAVLGLVIRLLLDRRGESLAIARARGARPSRIRGTLAAEALSLSIPAAVIGVLAGIALIPGTLAPGHLAAPALVALAPALLVGAWPLSSGRTRTDLGRRAGTVRRVAEIVVVTLAAGAVVLLVQRGVAGDAVVFDPLLVATPLLLTLAACVVALRLMPVPLAALVAQARRRAGLIAFLGAARSLRDQVAGLAPVLAMIVAVSITVFSAVLLSTTTSGTADAAAARVGGDLAVRGVLGSEGLGGRLAGLDGVEATVDVRVQNTGAVELAGREVGTAIVLADGPQLARVQHDMRAALPSQPALGERIDGAIPVFVSPALAGIVGEGAVTAGGEELTIVGTLSDTSAWSARSAVLVADVAFADELLGISQVVGTTTVRVDGDLASVADLVREELPTGSIVVTRDEALADLRDNPGVTGLVTALAAAILLAAVLCGLAAAISLALSADRRSALITVLRPFGSSRGQRNALLAWEVAPMAGVALVVGVVLGVVLAAIVSAGIDLRPFTGGATQPVVTIDPLVIALVAAGFAALILLSTTIAARAARRSEHHA